jgi:hypothetical protein
VGVAIVRAAALEALAVAVTAGVSWTSQGPVVTTVVAPDSSASAAAPRVERLMERWGCSPTGLAPGVVPRHALVRGRDDRVRVTGFDRGWASYVGERPGTLVAVCP